MSNPFFVNTIDLLPATKARAGDVESNLTAVEAGFDEVEQYFDRTLRGARANPVIPEIPDAATRAGKALTFDGSGNPAATVSTTEISNAQTYATNAQASATAAAGSAVAAAGSAASAAASLDSFDDRYLGPKASNPTLDNDGNALLVGALYWNSAVGDMRVWSGSAWVTFSSFVAKSGDTMTGPLAQAAGTAALPSYTFSGDTNTGMWSPGADILAWSTGGSERLRIDTGGNVGIGGTPSYKLDVQGSVATAVRVKGGSGANQGSAYLITRAASGSSLAAFGDRATLLGGTPDQVASIYTDTGIPLTFDIGGSERLRIDTSGNVGVGVTPAAWGVGSLALQFGGNPRIAGQNAITFSGNVYFDGTNWRYLSTNFAALYSLHNNNAGVHSWSTAPSGTAGNVATFTERLQIDNSGNVLVTGSGGLGYGVGSGGTVTQATSKVTTVTLNKPCGLITMNNAALGAGATAVFVCNNSLVSVNELVIAEISGGGDPLNYRLRALAGGGIITFAITNITGGSLSDALDVRFAVIKGATS